MWKLVLALVMLFVLAGFDEAYSPPEILAEDPALPEGYSASQALRLDLPAVLALAMQHNLGMAIERKEVKAADLTAHSASRSLYEPTVSGSYTRSSSGNGWHFGATSQLPTGGHVAIDSDGSAVSASITQPLLRGFSLDLAIPRYSILTARIAAARERHELAITAATVIRETEAAYWDVVYALYSYNVTVKSKTLAHDTVELVTRQIAAGLIPSSDLIGAENTLAQRKIAVLTAAQQVEQAWDTLRTIIHLPRDQWTRPLLPTDRPRFEPKPRRTFDAAFATAMKQRPELAQIELDRETVSLALRKAKNDALPQVDVGITVDNAQGFGVMGTVSWTPLQWASKANTELTRIQRDVQTIGTEQRVQAIWNEVRSAVRGQEAAALEVVATAQSRKLALATLSIETQKYLAGDSSNLAVAQLQSGLASAELSELQALIAHEKAETGVLVSTGQLLEHRHIKLEVVR